MKKLLVIVCIGILITALMNGCTIPQITAAKVYINQNNYDKALEQSLLAIQVAPDNPQAWFILGESYFHKEQYKEMKDAFNKSLEISATYKTQIDNRVNTVYADLFNKGVGHVNAGEHEKASELFTLDTYISPENTGAYKNLAFTQIQLGDDSTALKTYNTALALDPKDSTIHEVIGILHYRIANYEKCIESMSKVMELVSPKGKLYAEALYHTALAYDLSGDSEKAIEIYTQAIEKNPDNAADLYFNLARLYVDKARFEDAIQSFEKVLESRPDDFESEFNIGYSLTQLEEFKEAVPHFEKAIEIQPDNYRAWNKLGIAAVRAGEIEKGTKAFNEATRLKPEE